MKKVIIYNNSGYIDSESTVKDCLSVPEFWSEWDIRKYIDDNYIDGWTYDFWWFWDLDFTEVK